jgi:hypothetical protein
MGVGKRRTAVREYSLTAVLFFKDRDALFKY